VEVGVPLAALICGLLARQVWVARPWRAAGADRQLAWGVLAVIGLHSLVEYPLWYGPFQLATVLGAWLLWREAVPAKSSMKKTALARVFIGVIAIVCIAILAYAAWDYRRVSQLYVAYDARVAAYRDNTLEKARSSWLFQEQVGFAELSTTALQPEIAAYLHASARWLLHFSPEPRVAQKLIDSATLLGRSEEARFFAERYQAAFPQSYQDWVAASGRDEAP
jgi:hypothetical protein